MSKNQKAKLRKIKEEHGVYWSRSIRYATTQVLGRVIKMCAQESMHLISDRHPQYFESISIDLKDFSIQHETVSSLLTRNFQNKLFPINHSDLLVRHWIKAFTRETIAFSKTAGSMCQRFLLFVIAKNYMKPQFYSRHKNRPKAHFQSPAQALGLFDKMLTFRDVFSKRSLFVPKGVGADWESFFVCSVPDWCRRHKKSEQLRALLSH